MCMCTGFVYLITFSSFFYLKIWFVTTLIRYLLRSWWTVFGSSDNRSLAWSVGPGQSLETWNYSPLSKHLGQAIGEGKYVM